jgi:hypothetical protein
MLLLTTYFKKDQTRQDRFWSETKASMPKLARKSVQAEQDKV